ncbi:MAG: hypothetical protein WBB42_11650 [Polyangiales bacterium]
MLGRDHPELARDDPELGRLRPAPRDESDLGRWTLLARLGFELLAGRLIEAREDVDADGLSTLLVREGLTRGRLTMALLALDRETELVRVGPAPERPTALVAAAELGGRWTTVVLAGIVRARLTESTRLVLGRVRVTVPVRVLGARVTVWVRVGIVRTRPTELVCLTGPRLERAAGGLARTLVDRYGTPLFTGTG